MPETFKMSYDVRMEGSPNPDIKTLTCSNGNYRASVFRDRTDPDFFNSFHIGTVEMEFGEGPDANLTAINHNGKKVYPI